MGSIHMGRHSEFTQELGNEICELLADGLSVRTIAAQLGIERRTIRRWRDDIEDFRSQYARAREEGMDAEADLIIEIADSATEQDYGAKRLQVDTRKWRMSKIAPKQYGDRQTHDHTGSVDLVTSVTVNRKLPSGNG